MAINWCKPLNEWQQLFRGWITLPKPDALLDASIFFDFRPVAGSLPLEALDNIISHAKKERRFLAHMLAGALAFRPALGLFNQLRTENGTIDLKRKGIAPIVGLARAAALTAGSRARSTVERLRIGGASGLIFDAATAEDLTEVLRLLLRLRLRAQLAAWHERQPISHAVKVAQLSRIERRQLREGFVAVKQLQDNLRGVWQLDRLA
jgi:CBS domain-containing protein